MGAATLSTAGRPSCLDLTPHVIDEHPLLGELDGGSLQVDELALVRLDDAVGSGPFRVGSLLAGRAHHSSATPV